MSRKSVLHLFPFCCDLNSHADDEDESKRMFEFESLIGVFDDGVAMRWMRQSLRWHCGEDDADADAVMREMRADSQAECCTCVSSK